MVNEIIEEIKKGLTGDLEADMNYLQQHTMKYVSHPKAPEILQIISEMTFDLLPEEKQQQLKKTMFIGDKRIDQFYNDVMVELNKKNLDGALELMAKIESKADECFAQDNSFSFRNRLEEHLYAHIYKPADKMTRTPFDFCKYFCAYGYMLVEKRQPEEAVKKLEKAVKYNPVNVEPRFEMAESYKMMKNYEKLLNCTRDMLNICVTPQQLARCYTNLGYYCVGIKDYDSAVAFYYESLIYDDNKNVVGELQHVAAIQMKDITPPERKDVLAAFKKYGVDNGPNQDTVNLIYSLGCYCMEHNAPPQESLFYMELVYGLTRDPKVQETIDMLNAQIAVQRSKNE